MSGKPDIGGRPTFETAAARPPQDEADRGRVRYFLCRRYLLRRGKIKVMYWPLPLLETIVLLTALSSLAATLVLLIVGSRVKIGEPCLVGLGLMPFGVYVCLVVALYIFGQRPFVTSSLWLGLKVMFLFIAPNFLLAFALAIGMLIWLLRKNSNQTTRHLFCLTLLGVHSRGLFWAYQLSIKL